MLQSPRFFVRSRSVTACVCAGLAASAGLLLSAGAGEAFSAQPAAGAEGLARHADEEGVRKLLARHLTRVALIDLSGVQTPQMVDYEVASLLLSYAHDLAPRDEEILRRYIEAAYHAGHEQLVLDLSRRLIAADIAPNDSVAQLRLITDSIARRNQTAEERLQSYEEFLGPRGRAFDPAIRSRLALDAALLLRERGDQRGFLEKLTLATQLDPAHKEAAAIAATVIAESGQGARATLEGLTLLLMADPADPNVHLAIARHLAASGAFAAAERFHRNAAVILQAAGALDETVQIENRILAWHSRGADAVLKQMNRELLLAQDAAARAIRIARDAGRPVQEMTQPEDIRFSLRVAGLAAMMAQASGDEMAAGRLIQDMAVEASRTLRSVEDAVRRGQIPEQRAAVALVSLLIQMQTARLWTGIDIDTVAGDLGDPRNREILEVVSPDTLRILDGWLAVRRGKPEEALGMLGPLANSDIFALLGVGAAYEALNETEQAREAYSEVLHRAPLEAAGAWARTRLLALGHQEDPRQVAALERLAATVPAWIDEMVTNPRRFVQFSARALDRNPEALDPQIIRISIRNVSDIPLALGSDRAINSRMLIAPQLEIEGSAAQQEMILPEVIELDRRLRLMPRETLEVDIWAGTGLTGWLVDVRANQTIRSRWRIVQGFVLDNVQRYRAGPMSQIAETGAITRAPLPEASLSPEMLAARVASGAPAALPRLAAAVRAQLRTGPKEALNPVITAFAERYRSLAPTERAAIIATLPHASLSPQMAEFDRLIRDDSEPLVVATVLATRITNPEDEYLTRAAGLGDARLAALAQGIAQRLTQHPDAHLFSRFGQGEEQDRGGAAR
jgi:tetratricopeptide (TPR) repeat protein